MTDTIDTHDEETSRRIQEALSFFDSPQKKAWQEQRLSNSADDLSHSLPVGVKLLKEGYSKELMKTLDL